ncbi:uncharacterized protein AKAME5_001895600 [Lates japonicus]|uniref:Uncharacterized protein n=1 Tax=Lates japonicus TaxID=270547 RepID=A0AAD3RGX6_LATJO|nr:uncharacterized protein AKAME5_001895600 [Lates japonicus]
MVTHQQGWDPCHPCANDVYWSTAQDSTSCSPALLMLGREIWTLAEIMLGKPSDLPVDPDYARRIQDLLESAHKVTRGQLLRARARQRRNYDM